MNVYDERIYKLCYAGKIDIEEHILPYSLFPNHAYRWFQEEKVDKEKFIQFTQEQVCLPEESTQVAKMRKNYGN